MSCPSWSYSRHPEIYKSLRCFRFALEMREVRRFRVAVRRGAQGLTLKLTDASAAKLRRRLVEAGPDASYRFDYDSQEAVIEVPVWKAEEKKGEAPADGVAEG